LDSGVMNFRVADVTAEAVFADPGGSAPPVIVLHEVWGMTPFIESVCDKLAGHGFAAFAPVLYWRDRDLFSRKNVREAMSVVWDLPLGERYDRRKLGTAFRKARASAEARRLLGTLYDRSYRSLLTGDAAALARSVSGRRRKFGVVGYSMGGGLALGLAAKLRGICACATFSAEPPRSADLARIRAPILSFYGSEDEFMTARVPEFVADALRLGKALTLTIYPSAGHEFFDRDNPSGYDPGAAAESWRALIQFLADRLR